MSQIRFRIGKNDQLATKTMQTPHKTDNPAIDGVRIYCAFDEIRPISALLPHPKNANGHPPAQVEAYAAVLKANGIRRPVTISRLSGFITRGHGLALAAAHLGLSGLPIDLQEYEDELAELADLIADNRLAGLSEQDELAILEIVSKMETPEAAGFTGEEIAAILEAAEPAPLPPSIEQNIAEIESIKAMRRKGNDSTESKNDTEKYLIIVYRSRKEKELELKRLGLPLDERYLPAAGFSLRRKAIKIGNMNFGKAAPADHSGACG
jgi:hypothetical protein